jgi:hypothetical protein
LFKCAVNDRKIRILLWPKIFFSIAY